MIKCSTCGTTATGAAPTAAPPKLLHAGEVARLAGLHKTTVLQAVRRAVDPDGVFLNDYLRGWFNDQTPAAELPEEEQALDRVA